MSIIEDLGIFDTHADQAGDVEKTTVGDRIAFGFPVFKSPMLLLVQFPQGVDVRHVFACRVRKRDLRSIESEMAAVYAEATGSQHVLERFGQNWQNKWPRVPINIEMIGIGAVPSLP